MSGSGQSTYSTRGARARLHARRDGVDALRGEAAKLRGRGALAPVMAPSLEMSIEHVEQRWSGCTT
jgi:hypothetical protein